jgi:hypothetical protein
MKGECERRLIQAGTRNRLQTLLKLRLNAERVGWRNAPARQAGSKSSSSLDGVAHLLKIRDEPPVLFVAIFATQKWHRPLIDLYQAVAAFGENLLQFRKEFFPVHFNHEKIRKP